MRKLAVLTVVVFITAGVYGTSTASAHWFMTPGKIARMKTAQKKVNAYTKNIAHARGAIRFAKSHKAFFTNTTYSSVMRGHRWLIKYSLTKIEELRWLTIPPHYADWLCIHHYEGSWQDSGDPYWGGLQMDRGFMRTYAPSWLLRRGWANVWTPLQQMWVAEHAYASGRGFYPWPNTAHYCGLI